MKTVALSEVVNQMQSHLESVSPGQPFRISEAAQPGDGVWQGDLGICLIDKVPEGYKKINRPKEEHKKLVFGETEGARHCLDSLNGVILYHPDIWTEESLTGPVFELKAERTIEHPKHGNVTVPSGFIVQITYQREWDAEQRRERRNAD